MADEAERLLGEDLLAALDVRPHNLNFRHEPHSTRVRQHNQAGCAHHASSRPAIEITVPACAPDVVVRSAYWQGVTVLTAEVWAWRWTNGGVSGWAACWTGN